MKRYTITKDFLENTPRPTQRPEQTLKFRLKDDDGQVYFEGYMVPNQSERLFEPLDEFGEGYGCTSIEIRELGKWVQV